MNYPASNDPDPIQMQRSIADLMRQTEELAQQVRLFQDKLQTAFIRGYQLGHHNGKELERDARRVVVPDDGKVVDIVLPDGRVVAVTWNNIEDDALPELEISFPAEFTANCWLPNMTPAKPLPGAKNALVTNWIAVPIEKAA